MKAYTDGACKGNPGVGGWGYVIVSGGEVLAERFGHEPRTTNNRMELQAVLELLHADYKEVKAVYTDSSYVHNGISQWMHKWKRKGWITSTGSAVKNSDLWKQIYELWPKHMTIHKVKGHSNDKWNEYADALANKGARNEDTEEG